MIRFTINLATRPYLDARRVRHGCLVIVVLLVMLLAWNGIRISENMGELHRLGSENAALEGRLNSRPAGVSEKEYARLLASIHFFNGVIERRSYNWLGLLDHLENATPDGVALVSLKPDKQGTELKLEGRAKGFSGVRGYLERLEDSHAFSDVLLLSNRELKVGERDRGIQFTISCRVVPQ